MPSDELSASVIIPCYNVARWLPRCLAEVLAALPPASEVIAVDDGSSDETLALLRACRDPRLTVLTQPNRGVSSARNRALDVACGRLVFFVDPDDGVEPGFFTSMMAELEASAADYCLCGYSECEDGASDIRTVSLKGDYRYLTNAEIVGRYLPRIFGYSFADMRAWYAGTPLFSGREMASACRAVFRRALIEERHIRFDESISLFEDAMFNAEYLLAAKRMTCLDRPLYRITCRRSGAMNSVPKDGSRYCRNKLQLLRRREALDRQAGGALAPLYAATNVLSVLEIVLCIVRRRIPFAEGRRILQDYLAVPSVRAAIEAFPLSLRHPLLLVSVLVLRLMPTPHASLTST